MSPDSNASPEEDPKDEPEVTGQESGKPSKVATKRRTKTGCLTCRKRRIKCGEERPICKNCIKSKRDCAGYNPPLIYNSKQNGAQYSTLGYDLYPSHAYPGPSHTLDRCVHPPSGPPHPSAGLPPNFGNSQPYTSATESTFLDQSSVSSYNPSIAQGAIHRESGQSPQHVQWARPTPRLSVSFDQSFAFANLSPGVPTGMPTAFHAAQDFQNEASPYTASLANISNPMTVPIQGSIYSSNPEVSGVMHRPSIVSNPSTFDGQHYPLATETEIEDPDDPFDVMDETLDWVDSARGPYDIASRRPSISLSPLLSERSHHIFQHFLMVTAPCMSIFDRLEDLGPNRLPKMVWTTGLPQMALNHPALAHGILAISALQLSRIGQGSLEVASKHFMCSLRRVGKLLASDQTRHQVSTLATVLLLAYYEVIEGDHAKWCLHLSGAARFVMEHDYAGMIRTVRRMRNRAKTNISQPWVRESVLSGTDIIRIAGIPEQLLDDKDWDVDYRIVSKLMGVDVNYDNQTQPNFVHIQNVRDLSISEIENLKILMEMYWWYCKQDIFQSMLSGDAPMLPFSKWKYCPPRGPIGQPDRAFATVDHLWLLMCRLVTFGAKDRIRKQKVVASQNGNWIPPPGFLPKPPTDATGDRQTGVDSTGSGQSSSTNRSRKGTPPTANEGRARSKPPLPTPPQPMMYGMIPPPTGPVYMSSSFKAMDAELQKDAGQTPESSTSNDSTSSELELQKALEEHASITKAFDDFESLLGPGFGPLPDEGKLTTPFGPVIFFATPTIATLWTFYYVGRILLRRMHPHSPPAAMVSAGVNAFFTREHAYLIGRICGGLYARHGELVKTGYVDHMYTAAVMETTFSLLFAAVQYQEAAQRAWTIGKLNDIFMMTGWASSAAIASACEATWERMGQAKKGPPYQRALNIYATDVRVNGKTRHSDDDGKMTEDIVREHESRFVSHDRELVISHGSTRAFWAFGLLSMEEDLKKMDLSDNVGNEE